MRAPSERATESPTTRIRNVPGDSSLAGGMTPNGTGAFSCDSPVAEGAGKTAAGEGGAGDEDDLDGASGGVAPTTRVAARRHTTASPNADGTTTTGGPHRIPCSRM